MFFPHRIFPGKIIPVQPFPSLTLEWPTNKVTIVGKNFCRWENLVGPFLEHKILGPRPPCPPTAPVSTTLPLDPMHRGRLGAVRDPNTPHPNSPRPSRGPKCLKGPDHSTSQYGKIGYRRRHRKILVPNLKGLVKQVTHVFELQNAHFFLGISRGSQEGKICAATFGFVPVLGTPRRQG